MAYDLLNIISIIFTFCLTQYNITPKVISLATLLIIWDSSNQEGRDLDLSILLRTTKHVNESNALFVLDITKNLHHLRD